MTNPAAGSKQRRTIHGHVVVAEGEMLKQLGRLSALTLTHVFLQASEHGTATLTINDAPWTLIRNSDQTFILQPGSPFRSSL
jgi:hypothetical protein